MVEIKIIPICPYCIGTGKLKAMQSGIDKNTSVRASDTTVECRHCKGTGLKV